MPVRNHRKCARLSVNEVMKHTPAISRIVPEVIRNGTYKVMFFSISMVIAIFLQRGGVWVNIDSEWDLVIAHPPCTHLAVSGARWFPEKQKDFRQQKACVFFMQMMLARAKRVAVENPIGIMSNCYRKPDQIIQPYQFGHPTLKATCLWLRNLPKLQSTDIVKPEVQEFVCSDGKVKRFGKGIGEAIHNGRILAWNDPMTAKLRSKTFTGIAKAMAEQWG